MKRSPWFEVYRDKDRRQPTTSTRWGKLIKGRWRWRLHSPNGNNLANPGEPFASKHNAIRSAKVVRGRNEWPILMRRDDGVWIPVAPTTVAL